MSVRTFLPRALQLLLSLSLSILLLVVVFITNVDSIVVGIIFLDLIAIVTIVPQYSFPI